MVVATNRFLLPIKRGQLGRKSCPTQSLLDLGLALFWYDMARFGVRKHLKTNFRPANGCDASCRFNENPQVISQVR